MQISQDHTRMIQSLVSNHFKQQEIKKKGFVVESQDFIPGKGQGLIILLHGAPGTGKTATAEAIAQSYRKPLFSVTCGDLGVTPESVESNLDAILRLAHLWDCVLLLDEADIFLAQRERNELSRNALVSG